MLSALARLQESGASIAPKPLPLGQKLSKAPVHKTWYFADLSSEVDISGVPSNPEVETHLSVEVDISGVPSNPEDETPPMEVEETVEPSADQESGVDTNPPLGSSRATGGIVRGAAKGNNPSYMDLIDMQDDDDILQNVPCTVWLYKYKGDSPQLVDPAHLKHIDVEGMVSFKLGPVLENIVDFEDDVERMFFIIIKFNLTHIIQILRFIYGNISKIFLTGLQWDHMKRLLPEQQIYNHIIL